MFISKRKIKGNTYFYLEDRIDGKKISISLGKKEQVEERIKDAFEKINREKALSNFKKTKKQKIKVLNDNELLALEFLKINYSLLKDFFPQGFKSFKEDEFLRYAQGSTAVEGNSLSLQEAALVIEKGTSIAGKKIEEIKEVENMKLAAEKSIKIREINEKSIKQIHSLIMKGFDEKNPGKYREEPIFITASKVKPPRSDLVPKKMAELINWLEKSGSKNMVEIYSEFHARFEEIHPFVDGNGRTGREILNIMLQNNGYPRAIINLENRGSYIALLERVQVNKEYFKFSKFIYLCLEKRAQEIRQIIDENKKNILLKIMNQALHWENV